MKTFPWRLVQGSDFRRSIDWAKKQPANPITAALKKTKKVAVAKVRG